MRLASNRASECRMSWLNDELPAEWPSKRTVSAGHDFSGFSTSQSENSFNADPTVAIQPNAGSEEPQWKQAIKPPQGDKSHRLTGLFKLGSTIESEKRTEAVAAQEPGEAKSRRASDLSDDSSSLRSFSTSHNESTSNEPKQPINRRLKVFGRADTYTNERLGCLLTSMGGNAQASQTAASQTTASQTAASQTRNDTERGSTDPRSQATRDVTHGFRNVSANESDADLANNLQSEGRKVLQGLAPFRPDLSAVPESSLDELEQQLTSQGTAPAASERPRGRAATPTVVGYETTTSNISRNFDSSSQTLESLPPGISNWDTAGGPFSEHNVPDESRPLAQRSVGELQPTTLEPPPGEHRLLKSQSSQTLVGSGRSHPSNKLRSLRSNRYDEFYPDPEAEISNLGIREPVHSSGSFSGNHSALLPAQAHLSAENHIEEFPDEFSSSIEQPTTDSTSSIRIHRPSTRGGNTPPVVQRERSPRERSSKDSVETRSLRDVKRSKEYARQSPKSGQLAALQPDISSRLPAAMHDNSLRSGSSHSSRIPMQEAFDVTPDGYTRVSFNPHTQTRAPHRSPTRSRSDAAPFSRVVSDGPANETSSEAEQPAQVDHSIAQRDVSFSASLELLAQLIRERAGKVGLTDLDSVDSIDLSDCGLESLVGLDRFLPQLVTLFLHDNSIRSLQGLPFQLVHLDLSNNKISNLNTFPMSFVSTLILSNNELESLEPLANLRALSSLDVSGNKLQSLKGIENLTALRTLNLRGNQLKSLSLNLGMLVELDAAYNSLTAVKLNTPNLESLDLEGNEVGALVEPLTNLRELNIRNNGAVVDFEGWHSLETLLYDGNSVARNFEAVAGILITCSWEQPRSASQKHARGEPHWHHRSEIPVSLLSSIRDLKLGGRPIGWPFPSDSSVFSAQHLDLSLCAIRELPHNLGERFPFLRSLNLAFNKLDDSCVPVLARCSRLERVSVFGNRLGVTGLQLAEKLPQLRVLDSRNQKQSRCPVRHGEYSTEVYMAMTNSDGPSVGSVVRTTLENLQWIDGKWTNHATNTKLTTRPGFVSALYPTAWEPPEAADVSQTRGDGDFTVFGALGKWDLIEAMYVHHWQAQRS